MPPQWQLQENEATSPRLEWVKPTLALAAGHLVTHACPLLLGWGEAPSRVVVSVGRGSHWLGRPLLALLRGQVQRALGWDGWRALGPWGSAPLPDLWHRPWSEGLSSF